ncbi:protein PF3D7_1417600 [Parasteatoda tepidariorum]|uniref:protein PF3D7_1417600 n=1 Tax=Parasteatoda tepidariorum TaxID=114398 RepID=UPI001C723533|nr:uncharacterized protein LOC107443845 [Parasteatoda tepidariorum]
MSPRKDKPSVSQDVSISKSKRKGVQKIKISSKVKPVKLRKNVVGESLEKADLKTVISPKAVRNKETAPKNLKKILSTEILPKSCEKCLISEKSASCSKQASSEKIKVAVTETESTLNRKKHPKSKISKSKLHEIKNTITDSRTKVITSSKNEMCTGENLSTKKPVTLKKRLNIKRHPKVKDQITLPVDVEENLISSKNEMCTGENLSTKKPVTLKKRLNAKRHPKVKDQITLPVNVEENLISSKNEMCTGENLSTKKPVTLKKKLNIKRHPKVKDQITLPVDVEENLELVKEDNSSLQILLNEKNSESHQDSDSNSSLESAKISDSSVLYFPFGGMGGKLSAFKSRYKTKMLALNSPRRSHGGNKALPLLKKKQNKGKIQAEVNKSNFKCLNNKISSNTSKNIKSVKCIQGRKRLSKKINNHQICKVENIHVKENSEFNTSTSGTNECNQALVENVLAQRLKVLKNMMQCSSVKSCESDSIAAETNLIVSDNLKKDQQNDSNLFPFNTNMTIYECSPEDLGIVKPNLPKYVEPIDSTFNCLNENFQQSISPSKNPINSLFNNEEISYPFKADQTNNICNLSFDLFGITDPDINNYLQNELLYDEPFDSTAEFLTNSCEEPEDLKIEPVLNYDLKGENDPYANPVDMPMLISAYKHFVSKYNPTITTTDSPIFKNSQTPQESLESQENFNCEPKTMLDTLSENFNNEINSNKIDVTRREESIQETLHALVSHPISQVNNEKTDFNYKGLDLDQGDICINNCDKLGEVENETSNLDDGTSNKQVPKQCVTQPRKKKREIWSYKKRRKVKSSKKICRSICIDNNVCKTQKLNKTKEIGEMNTDSYLTVNSVLKPDEQHMLLSISLNRNKTSTLANVNQCTPKHVDTNSIETFKMENKSKNSSNVLKNLVPGNMLTPEMDKDLINNLNQCSMLSEEVSSNTNSVGLNISGNIPCFNTAFTSEDLNNLTPVSEIHEPQFFVENIDVDQLQDKITPKVIQAIGAKRLSQSELQPMLNNHNVVNSMNPSLKITLAKECCSKLECKELLSSEYSMTFSNSNDVFLNFTESQKQPLLTDIEFQQNKGLSVNEHLQCSSSEEKENLFLPENSEGTSENSKQVRETLTERQLEEINRQKEASENVSQKETLGIVRHEEVLESSMPEDTFEGGLKLIADDIRLSEINGKAENLEVKEMVKTVKLSSETDCKGDKYFFLNHEVSLPDNDHLKVTFRTTENDSKINQFKLLNLKGVNKHIFSAKQLLKNKSNSVDDNIKVVIDNMHRKVKYDSEKSDAGRKNSKSPKNLIVEENEKQLVYENQNMGNQLLNVKQLMSTKCSNEESLEQLQISLSGKQVLTESKDNRACDKSKFDSEKTDSGRKCKLDTIQSCVENGSSPTYENQFIEEKQLNETVCSTHGNQKQTMTSISDNQVPAKENKKSCKAKPSLKICSLFDLAVGKKLTKPKSKISKKKSTEVKDTSDNHKEIPNDNNLSCKSKLPKKVSASKTKTSETVSDSDILKYIKSSDAEIKVKKKTKSNNEILKYNGSSYVTQNHLSEKCQTSPSKNNPSSHTSLLSKKNGHSEIFNNNQSVQDDLNLVTNFYSDEDSCQNCYETSVSVPQAHVNGNDPVPKNNSDTFRTPCEQEKRAKNFTYFNNVDDELILDFEGESEIDTESLRDWSVSNGTQSQFNKYIPPGDRGKYSFENGLEINSAFDEGPSSLNINDSISELFVTEQAVKNLQQDFKIRRTPKWTRMSGCSSEDSDDDEHSFKRRRADQQDEDTSSKYSISTSSEKSQQSRKSFKNHAQETLTNKCVPSSPSRNESNPQIPLDDGKSMHEILDLIERKCRKRSINEALEVARKYIPVSSEDTKLVIIKRLFTNTIECLKSRHSYVDSEACERTFASICEIMHNSNLYETELCSMIVFECIQIDNYSYADSILCACKEKYIPLLPDAISSYANLLISRESSIIESLNFLEFVKCVCNLPLPKYLLHKALESCLNEENVFRIPISEELKLISSVLCGINSDDVDCCLMQKFLLCCIDNEHWGKIAELFRAWIKKSALCDCLCQVLVIKAEDCGSSYEKFAAALHGDMNDELPMHHAARFGQIGVLLMLEAFSNGHHKSALEILYILHQYKINYFELQAPAYYINYPTLFTQDLIDPLEVFIFPYTVAFTAVDICLHCERPIDAFDIFRNFSYLTTEEISNPKLKSHVTIHRFNFLLKIAEHLVPIDTLNRGVDCMQQLLSTAEKDFAMEEIVDFKKNLGLVYDECLIRLLNLEQIKIAHELSQHSNGPLREILKLKPQVLRGLVISYAQTERLAEAKELFKMGLFMRNVYCIKKPEIDDPSWCLTIVSSWTKYEIKLAIEVYVEMLFPVLFLKHSKSDDEGYTIRIKFEEDKIIYYDVNCLEQLSKRTESVMNRTRNVLTNLDSELTWTEDPVHKVLIVQAETFYNFWKKKNNSEGCVPTFLKLPIISSRKKILHTSEKSDNVIPSGQSETMVMTNSPTRGITTGNNLRKSCDDEIASSSDVSLSSLSLPNSVELSPLKYHVPNDTCYKSKLNFQSQEVDDTDKVESIGISNSLSDNQGDLDSNDAFHNNVVNKDFLSTLQNSGSLNSKAHSSPAKNCVSLKEPSPFSVKNKTSELKSSSIKSNPSEQTELRKSTNPFSSHIGNQGPMSARSCFRTGNKVLKKLKVSGQSKTIPLTSTSNLNFAPASSGTLSVVTASEGLPQPIVPGKFASKCRQKPINIDGFSHFSDEDHSKIIQFLRTKILLKHKELKAEELYEKAASLAKSFIQENNVQYKLDRKGMKLLSEFAVNNV